MIQGLVLSCLLILTLGQVACERGWSMKVLWAGNTICECGQLMAFYWANPSHDNKDNRSHLFCKDDKCPNRGLKFKLPEIELELMRRG